MQMIVNKWDPYINNLKKKSLPLHPNELMEVKKAKNDQHSELDYIFCLNKSSPIAALTLKLLKKMRYDYSFFKFYDEDHGIQPERAEQFTTAIILADLEASKNQHPGEDNDDSEDEADLLDAPYIADTEATNVKHHEEDENDDEFLNADVQAKKLRRKRKKKHQGMYPLKPTPSPPSSM